MEGFRKRAQEKIEDANILLQDVRANRLAARMSYDPAAGETEHKWSRMPLTVEVNQAGATTLPHYMSVLENQGEFNRKYRNLNGRTLVGEVTIYSFDENGTNYAEGESAQKAVFALLKDVKARLQELAIAVEQGDPTVANVEYFYGLSRLANVADKFGFNVYDVTEIFSKNGVSHLWARQSYERLKGNSDAGIVDKKEEKLAIISREGLLQRFGTQKLARSASANNSPMESRGPGGA